MQQYGRAAVEAIIGTYCKPWIEVEDNGVFLAETALKIPSEMVQWKYVCDLEGPNAPDPLVAPCLPIPCSENELAAFMLAGVGAMLPSVYGTWEVGPDQAMLGGLDFLATKSREALKAAYQAYRDATATVGPGVDLERRMEQLNAELARKNNGANALEGVFHSGISLDEQSARRERAEASIKDLKGRRQEAEDAFVWWRRAMVRQLLQPHIALLAPP